MSGCERGGAQHACETIGCTSVRYLYVLGVGTRGVVSRARGVVFRDARSGRVERMQVRQPFLSGEVDRPDTIHRGGTRQEQQKIRAHQQWNQTRAAPAVHAVAANTSKSKGKFGHGRTTSASARTHRSSASVSEALTLACTKFATRGMKAIIDAAFSSINESMSQ
jgi:hypothetical protein